MKFMKNDQDNQGNFTIDWPPYIGVSSEQKIDMLLWQVKELSSQLSEIKSMLSNKPNEKETDE